MAGSSVNAVFVFLFTFMGIIFRWIDMPTNPQSLLFPFITYQIFQKIAYISDLSPGLIVDIGYSTLRWDFEDALPMFQLSVESVSVSIKPGFTNKIFSKLLNMIKIFINIVN